MKLPYLTRSTRSLIRLQFLFTLLLFGLGASCNISQARPDYPAVVRSVFSPGENSVVGKANNSCKLCHDPAPPRFNPFGRDLKSALTSAHQVVLTPAILSSVADKDSDGDGLINAAEFRSDTLPGDASSHGEVTIKKNNPNAKAPVNPDPARGAQPLPASPLADLFAPKNLLFPDHAQHPILVHFPIALFFASLFFDLLGLIKKHSGLSFAGYATLIFAAVSSLPTVVTGLLAWRMKYGGAPLEGLLLYHLVTAIASAVLLLGLWWTRNHYNQRSQPVFARLYVFLAGLELVALTLAGHIGGSMVRGF